MKISKLQVIVITVTILALVIAIILTGSWQQPKPKTIVPKYELQAGEQRAPQAGRFELPEKENLTEKTIKEELIPEETIAALEKAEAPNAAKQADLASSEQAGTETKETMSPQQEDPDKFRKKYPDPKKLREIKERGLIVY